MKEGSVLGGEYREIPIDKVEAQSTNPNVMKDREFSRLVREIEESGMVDPIQVVDMGGTYRIVGGHHRHMACKSIGYEAIPAIVLTDEKWQDEDVQKLEMVKLNVIKGGLNPEKMMALYQDVSATYGEDSVADLMGFTDEQAFNKLIGETGRAMRDAGLPEDAVEEFEDIFDSATDEERTMENLTEILQRLYKKYGETVPQHYMYFDWGGKKHLYVEVNAKAFKGIERMMEVVERSGCDAGDFFLRMSNRFQSILREIVEDGAKEE